MILEEPTLDILITLDAHQTKLFNWKEDYCQFQL